MSQNYQRYQIILSENSAEFTMQGKKALGKCVLEAKGDSGKVIFGVQNLKPGVICNAYIVASDNVSGAAIDIGRIIVDEKGSAEIKWECSASDVDGSGIALNAFNVAGMMVLDENIVRAPIIGHKDKEVAWKNNLRLHSKRLMELTKADCEEDLEAEAAEQIEPEPTRVNQEPTAVFLEKDEIPPPPEPEPLPEFFETLEEGSSERAFKDVARQINEKLNEIDTMTLEEAYKAAAEPISDNLSFSESEGIYLQSIFGNCSKIRPFKEQDDDIQWIRITPNELNFLPDDFKRFKEDNLITAAYKKFNHLILGCKNQDNNAQIIFGMPDIHSKIGEESAYVSGLTEFKCCDCGDIGEGKHGYWLKTMNYKIDKENQF